MKVSTSRRAHDEIALMSPAGQRCAKGLRWSLEKCPLQTFMAKANEMFPGVYLWTGDGGRVRAVVQIEGHDATVLAIREL